MELTLQLLGGHLRRLAHLIRGPLATSHRFDLRCSHQTGNTVFAACHTRFLEIKEDAWAAEDTHAMVVEGSDQLDHFLVGLGPWGHRLKQASVITA
jgi:hypothetical protein